MGMRDRVRRACAVADAMVSSARTKSAGGSLVAGPGASIGVYGPNTPGLKRDRLRHFVGWQAAVVRVCAQRIAAQPILIAKKASMPNARGRQARKYAPGFIKTLAEGVQVVEAHWIKELLASPNEYLTGHATMFLTVASLEFEGEAYWYIDRSGDRPGLYYLSPDWVQPIHTDNQLFVGYRVTVYNTGHHQDVPPEDMVRFSVPDPKLPYTGCLSSLQSNALACVTDEYIQLAQQKTMANGIFPLHGLVIGRHPDVAGVPGMRPILTKEQRATLTAAIKQGYRGAINAGEPILLDGLIEDVKNLSLSPNELGFLDSSKNTKERITQGFLTNPIVMGAVEGVNRASATIASENWYAHKVNPLCDLISEGLTRQLAPKLDVDDLLLWVEHCRAHDPDAKRADMEQLAKYGCLTKNEMREAYDLAPMEEGGDEIATPSGPGAADPLGNGGAAANRGSTFPG